MQSKTFVLGLKLMMLGLSPLESKVCPHLKRDLPKLVESFVENKVCPLLNKKNQTNSNGSISAQFQPFEYALKTVI